MDDNNCLYCKADIPSGILNYYQHMMNCPEYKNRSPITRNKNNELSFYESQRTIEAMERNLRGHSIIETHYNLD